MAIGPNYSFTVQDSNVDSVGHEYQYTVEDLRTSATSHPYDYTVEQLRERATGHNLNYEVGQLDLGLIRSIQIAEQTIANDRLEKIPVQIISQANSRDLTQTVDLGMYLVPASQQVILLGILVEATNADTVTVPPQLSVGISSTEIFTVESLTDLNATGEVWTNWLVTSKSVLIEPGEQIEVRVTGGTATTLLANVYLLGLIIE